MDVKVGQDAGHTGIPSKGLYVEEVVVTASRGDGVVFPCHCWTGDEDKIAVEPGLGNEVPLGKSPYAVRDKCPRNHIISIPSFFTHNPFICSASSDTTYQVTFKTGDRPNAGTSAKPSLFYLAKTRVYDCLREETAINLRWTHGMLERCVYDCSELKASLPYFPLEESFPYEVDLPIWQGKYFLV